MGFFQVGQGMRGGENTLVPGRTLLIRTPSNSCHVSAHPCSVSGTPILSPDIPQHPGVVSTPQGSSNISLHRDHPASSPVLNPGICQRPGDFSQRTDSRRVGRHGSCGLLSLTCICPSFHSSGSILPSFSILLRLLF